MTTAGNEYYNKDELEAPAWLNKAFFNNVLRASEHDEALEVIEYKLSPASMKGDHYASVMFRANLVYKSANDAKTLNKSIIIKTLPEDDGNKNGLLKESYIFETEIGMYTQVIPKFEEMLRAIGDHTIMGAKCLAHSLAPRKYIVFEDLVAAGYQTLRDRDPNLAEIKAAYIKLAKWHALSYKLQQENPQFFENYKHSSFALDGKEAQGILASGIDYFINMLKQTAAFQIYLPYFEAISANLVQQTIESVCEYRMNPQKEAPYVLVHGDFHYKNMMFKHNPQNGDFLDVMLLDFQFCNVGPMTFDVQYSLYMLIVEKWRFDKMDELLLLYFQQFVETLRKIGFAGKIPSYEDFQHMRKRHSHFEIFLVTNFLPMMYALKDRNVETEDIIMKPECRQKLYFSKEYLDDLAVILPQMVKWDYIKV